MNPKLIGAIVVAVVLALAVGISAFLFDQNQILHEQNGQLQEQNTQLKNIAEANAAEVARLREEQRAAEKLLAERAEVQKMLVKEFDRLNKKLMEAATNDAPTRDWLSVRVPDRLLGLLREARGVRPQGGSPQGEPAPGAPR